MRTRSVDLAQRLIDELVVVFLRDIALEKLRRDGDRQIDGLVTNLLQRPHGFQLDLALGVLDQGLRLGLRASPQFLAEPLGVTTRFLEDGDGFPLRALELRRVLLQSSLRFVTVALGVGQRTVSERTCTT